MRYLYTVLFYLALPFILLRLLWKSRKNPAYRQRIKERFGYSAPRAGIWVHAVSVGEVLAAVPLIKKLLQQYPDTPLLVTTMTPTGAERVRATFGDTVLHRYTPYDLPRMTARFLDQVQPRVLVLIETELWPNFLHLCAQRKIPSVLLNARLSAKSAAGYQRLGALTRSMLNTISVVAAQNSTDGARFVALGLPPERLQISGSIKFDLELPEDLPARAQVLRQAWSAQRPVWIAASTHEGEDTIVLEAFKQVRAQLPELLLILVPRHPERFAKVAALCSKYSTQVQLRSAQLPCTTSTEIFLGDTMGELLLFYACADVAFVGGSLVNTGGHNPLEPAALGLPVIMGPHLFNFATISEQLEQAGALIIIEDADTLSAAVLDLLQNDIKYRKMRMGGRKVIEENRGALARQLQIVADVMQKASVE